MKPVSGALVQEIWGENLVVGERESGGWHLPHSLYIYLSLVQLQSWGFEKSPCLGLTPECEILKQSAWGWEREEDCSNWGDDSSMVARAWV